MALGLGNPSARSQQAIVVYKSGRLSMSSLSVRVHMFFFGETRLGLNCSFFLLEIGQEILQIWWLKNFK